MAVVGVAGWQPPAILTHANGWNGWDEDRKHSPLHSGETPSLLWGSQGENRHGHAHGGDTGSAGTD